MPRKKEPRYVDLPLEVLRDMSPDERMRLARELTSRMRREAWEEICEEHPDWPNWQRKLEFMRWIFDPEPLPRGLEEAMRERADETPPAF